MLGAKHYERAADTDVRLREGVVIVNAPLVHVSGVFRVVQAMLDGRRIALLERFTVDGWADVVRRHRPKTVSLVPTALRMVLDAEVDDDVFDERPFGHLGHRAARSRPRRRVHRSVRRAGARFVRRHRVRRWRGGLEPRRPSGVRHGQARQRRARPPRAARCGSSIPTSGPRLGTDDVGLLEVRASQLGTDEWVRTTDLAGVDADGFLWIVGRADETILRGGYKVQPEVIRAALEQDPAVAEASVVGVSDPRLGAVPVAAVQRRPGHEIDEGSAARRREQPPRAVRGPGRGRRGRRTSPHRVGEGRPRRGARAARRSVQRPCARHRDHGAVVVRGGAAAGSGRAGARPARAHQHRAVARANQSRSSSALAAVLRDVATPARRRTRRRTRRHASATMPRPTSASTSTTARDVGDYNPCFPRLRAPGRGRRQCARAPSSFPVCYEGPPGIVHGGFLAVFFDCVLQQLNCDLGLAGKTAELSLRFRRPTPLLTPLVVHARALVDGEPHPVARRAAPRRQGAVRVRHGGRGRQPRRAPGRVARAAHERPHRCTTVEPRAARPGRASSPTSSTSCATTTASPTPTPSRAAGCSPRPARAGAGRGSRVGLLFPTGVDFVLAWLATARIGAIAVPISTFSTPTELRDLLGRADVDVAARRARVPRQRLRRRDRGGRRLPPARTPPGCGAVPAERVARRRLRRARGACRRRCPTRCSTRSRTTSPPTTAW